MNDFSNGVTRHKEVFDPKTFKMMDEESCQLLDAPDTLWRVNKSNWTSSTPYISNYAQAGTIITTNVSEQVESLMTAAIKQHCNFALDDAVNFQHTYMFRGAFIPWHNDAHCDLACTFYLQDGDPNMGGLYLYTDMDDQQEFFDTKDPKIYGVSPEKNTMLLQHQIVHSVSALTPMTPVRRTIQAFLNFAK